MKVLNLYAGIGGNRKLWEDVEVTAVEIDPKIAEIYQDFFPDDIVVVGDAHQYLLDHCKEFDFVWSSPPCPTHSVTNSFLDAQGVIRYPDMSLWQEIIYLKHRYYGLWCVENVKSYYEPLYPPTEIGRHYCWANFLIASFRTSHNFNIANSRGSSRKGSDEYIKLLGKYHGFDLSHVNYSERGLLLRNCVYPPIGKHILDCARGNTQVPLTSFSISKRMEVGESG